MEKRKYLPVLSRFIPDSASNVTLREVSMRCDIHPEMIIRLVQLGLIDPVGQEKAKEVWIFPIETVSQVRKIIRLRNDLGINYSGIGIVLELLSRIEVLETRVRELGDEPS